MSKQPLMLVILDGWGEKEASDNNAITNAHTPYWDKLVTTYPKTTISGSGDDVGLPTGQMGNSEVGHLNIGAGRVVRQDYSRITHDIETGAFAQNDAILSSIHQVKQNDSALHIMGLLSPGGVHSHEAHILALCQLAHAKGLKKIYLHAFLDGRDTPPKSAEASLKKLTDFFSQTKCGRIASICGRYFAMDRDQRWERIESAFNCISDAKADHQFADPINALHSFYEQDIVDEFVPATIISGAESHTMEAGDNLIFMNFRADRARQISRAFCDPEFTEFPRRLACTDYRLVTLTQYQEGLNAAAAYPPLKLPNVLGEVLAQHQKTQLRIAETEKYAHVTFFFNGGVETPFPDETRVLVPSPKVATYDLQPEMNAPELTDKLVAAIQSNHYDVIIVNYANPDMVGHTGNFSATVKAIEAIDGCLSKLIPVLLAQNGQCLITADHGNAEQMHCHVTDQPHTAHTCEEVPLIFVGEKAEIIKNDGVLSDIAPTMLYIMGIKQPEEMTGQSLIKILSR